MRRPSSAIRLSVGTVALHGFDLSQTEVETLLRDALAALPLDRVRALVDATTPLDLANLRITVGARNRATMKQAVATALHDAILAASQGGCR